MILPDASTKNGTFISSPILKTLDMGAEVKGEVTLCIWSTGSLPVV
jgi:hypothetical protein